MLFSIILAYHLQVKSGASSILEACTSVEKAACVYLLDAIRERTDINHTVCFTL